MKKILFIIAILIITALPMFAQAGFQMLEVDGLQVTIDEIRFTQGYSDSTTVGSIAVNKTINLTGSLSDVFTAETSLNLEFGVSELEFDTINIQMSGGVGIKGHTYLADVTTHVYTSTSGIKKITGAGATWSAPSDYGYLAKTYIYHPGDDGETLETTFLQAMTSYEAGTPLDMSLLVDTYQVAYYWDGQDSSRHGFVDSWNQENPSYFPTGTEVIGISYLPLYMSVNQDLQSETYVVAVSSSDLTPVVGDFYNEKRTMNMTLVFNDSGTFFIGRTANWDGLEVSLSLPQFVRSALITGTSYSLNLNSYEDGSGWGSTSTLSDFTRQSVGGTDSFILTKSDGSTQTLYGVRVK
ncbi:MAG: hypothetical protein JEZ04_21925 [Spirochaetales bacterium]|nr:hypothetical protein [Spirochaetales bacterium]